MRRTIIYLTAIILLTACSSYIDDDEQLIYVRPANVARAVLIEDFTGQRCINCPDAADEIERLRQQYGDSVVIAVSIHGGPLAFSGSATAVGLRTAEGDLYTDYWDVSNTLPKGLVSRTTAPTNYDQWGTLVRQAVQQPATVRLQGAVSYDADARQLTATTTVLGIEAAAGAKLQLWLTESGITAMQSMPDGTVNRQYQHNHVFRTAINGPWGEDFPLAEGQERTVTHTATVAADWNADRLSVVAFVYNATGVLQVIESKVKH